MFSTGWDGCRWGIGWRYLHFPPILIILTVENLPVDGNCSKKSSHGYFGNMACFGEDVQGWEESIQHIQLHRDLDEPM
jgi:hypothetical protein